MQLVIKRFQYLSTLHLLFGNNALNFNQMKTLEHERG